MGNRIIIFFLYIFTDEKKNNPESTKFKVVDRLRITKPKIILAKCAVKVVEGKYF